MSIVDIIIYTIDWIFQHTILAILPSSVGGMSLADLQTYLDSTASTMISALSGFGFIAPVSLALLLVVIIFTAEFTLFLFHILMALVRLVRGGG